MQAKLAFVMRATRYKTLLPGSVLDRQSMLWLTEMKIEEVMPDFNIIRIQFLRTLELQNILKYIRPPMKKENKSRTTKKQSKTRTKSKFLLTQARKNSTV